MLLLRLEWITKTSFYRMQVFEFLYTNKYTNISVLSSKIKCWEDAFRPLTDVLDPNVMPSIDKVKKLSAVFADDIPDVEANGGRD